MAERSGFYNAELKSDGTYDKTYDATDFAGYFSKFIGNGIYAGGTDQLKVIPDTGLNVKVKTGSAFIDGYWYELDEDKTIQLSVATSTTGAKSTVIVAELNRTNREITVKAREFVSSVYPINTTNVHELVLAVISNRIGATEIKEADITDKRYEEEYCGIVSGVVQQLEMGGAYRQFAGQFDDWFDTIKGKLGTDLAGNLQQQIDALPVIRSGTADPDNSVGKDGDIYIKYKE